MQIDYSYGDPQSVTADTLILFVPEFSKITDKALKALDFASDGTLSLLLESKEFTGKEKQLVTIFSPNGYSSRRIVLVGLGDKKKVNHDSYRRAAGIASRHTSIRKSKTIAFHFDRVSDDSLFQATIEGFMLGAFKMRDYKTDEDNRKETGPRKIRFVVRDRKFLKKLQRSTERGRIIADGQILARRLSFIPSNDLTPRLLARQAEKLARENKLKCTVLQKDAIKKEKMGALLAVSQGSTEPPRFIIIEYKGAAAKRAPVVLVGKGVTFDSGGISIKASLDMHEMKGDMTGAAVVLATIVTAAKLKLPVNITVLIPSTENMPSGTALKPGDIVKSRKGLTIEIINTDAEGRLILADALDYAAGCKPEAVIDVATLTGAALYILGYAGAPIVSNSKKLADGIRRAAGSSAERVWELPLWDDYREAMKSPIADLWNSGGRPAATITAAAFLENFIGEHPWAHIDIAYKDLEKSGEPYTPKGPTGFGVRLLVELLSNWKKL